MSYPHVNLNVRDLSVAQATLVVLWASPLLLQLSQKARPFYNYEHIFKLVNGLNFRYSRHSDWHLDPGVVLSIVFQKLG